MSGILQELNPKSVFYYFEEISTIPRETGHTEKIREYIVRFAREHFLDYVIDTAGNIVVYKPASAGYEDHESIILQGHIDMVCEKNYDILPNFDFATDPLKIVATDEYIFAKGTTLGADDGIAVAYMLSILSDSGCKHPAIEAVFTVDEEDGMRGALNFDASNVKSRRMINLDHEVEGEILTCCAGGRRVKLLFPVTKMKKSGIRYDIVLCGLTGGHSGLEIDKGRGNAGLMLGRVLHNITKKVNFSLAYIAGGLTDSAIPREAKAELIVDPEDINTVEDIVSEFSDIFNKEYEGIEDNITLYGQNMGETTTVVLDVMSKKRIGFMLNTMPDGIIRMSRYSDCLVQTSLNTGIIKLKDECFEMVVNIRSMFESEKEALSDKVRYLCEAIGGEYIVETDYPGWELNEKSDLREIAFETYQHVFAHNPKLVGFHAGLECGVLHNKIKGLDIVSFGPQITGIHTPKEKLSIASAARVYEYLLKVLENA